MCPISGSSVRRKTSVRTQTNIVIEISTNFTVVVLRLMGRSMRYSWNFTQRVAGAVFAKGRVVVVRGIRRR